MGTWARGLAMAGLGMLGGFGGALCGEALFLGQAAPARRIGFVFDLSGSMLVRPSGGESQLETLRRAAMGFLDAPAFARDELALVGFANDARVLCAPTREHARLSEALGALEGGGDTAMGRGLDVAREALLAGEPAHEPWILLFSDGKPHGGRDALGHARRAARACREAGLRLAAVGTGLADRELLAELTGDPASVFLSEPERLGEAFLRSGDYIASREMLSTRAAPTDLGASVRRAGAWSALLALGAGLSLVAGQNRRLRRRPALGAGRAALVGLGALATGIAAAAQGSFYAVSGIEALLPLARRAAWVLLGAGIALGLSTFVPNLPRRRTCLAGALGGAGAAECFLALVPRFGDPAGRLAAAALLGLLTGAMVLWIEARVRKAWLVTRWRDGESSTILLGEQPILVGRSPAAHICPSWDEPLPEAIGRFELRGSELRYVDAATGKARRLSGGERLDFGAAAVEVHVEVHAEMHAEGISKRGASPASAAPRARRKPEPSAPIPRARRSGECLRGESNPHSR